MVDVLEIHVGKQMKTFQWKNSDDDGEMMKVELPGKRKKTKEEVDGWRTT